MLISPCIDKIFRWIFATCDKISFSSSLQSFDAWPDMARFMLMLARSEQHDDVRVQTEIRTTFMYSLGSAYTLKLKVRVCWCSTNYANCPKCYALYTSKLYSQLPVHVPTRVGVCLEARDAACTACVRVYGKRRSTVVAQK